MILTQLTIAMNSIKLCFLLSLIMTGNEYYEDKSLNNMEIHSKHSDRAYNAMTVFLVMAGT